MARGWVEEEMGIRRRQAARRSLGSGRECLYGLVWGFGFGWEAVGLIAERNMCALQACLLSYMGTSFIECA